MPHVTTYNPKLKVIETTFTGTHTPASSWEIRTQVAQIARETGCFLWLGDFSKASFSFSLLETAEFPVQVSETLAGFGFDARQFKRAAVAGDQQAAKFLEAVSARHGHRLKTFTSMEAALEWLMAEE